eukprot:360648-Chlamydomonas_euryale.AAC.2
MDLKGWAGSLKRIGWAVGKGRQCRWKGLAGLFGKIGSAVEEDRLGCWKGGGPSTLIKQAQLPPFTGHAPVRMHRLGCTD